MNTKSLNLLNFLKSNKDLKLNKIINVDDLDKFLDFTIQMRNSINNIDNDILSKDQFVDILFNFSCINPIPLANNKIEIRPSPIHGNGVFATDDITKGTIITFYPAHAVFINGELGSDDNEFLKIIKKNKYDQSYGVCGNSYGYDFLNIIGNPKKYENKLLLGHMINDCVGNIFKDIPFNEIKDNEIKFKNCTVSYFLHGIKKMNCRLEYHPKYPIIYILTSRDIKQNEELLTLYGPSYWFDINYNKSDRQDNIWSTMYQKIYDTNFSKFIFALNYL